VANDAVAAIKRINNPYIAAFGLVGNEAVTPLVEFKRALNDAWHDLGLGLVPHIAEQRVENALDFFAAIPDDALKNPQQGTRKLRVGHGTLMHRSSALIKQFADAGLCVEVCLSANKRIGVPAEIAAMHPDNKATSADGTYTVTLDLPLRSYFQDLSTHPVPLMTTAGIPVCLGSDNPLLMNTNIAKEYALAAKYLNFSHEQCLQITRDAINFANVDKLTSARLLKLVDSYTLGNEHSAQTCLGYLSARENIFADKQRIP